MSDAQERVTAKEARKAFLDIFAHRYADPIADAERDRDHGTVLVYINQSEARIRDLEEALRDLVDEASEAWVALDRYGDVGRFEDHDDGATFRARRTINRETTDDT